MGCPDSNCSEERWLTKIFCGLPKLNAVTVRDSYPIVQMDECIDSLRDALIFSTVDANHSYWQVETEDPDRNMTSFTFHHGLYWFSGMQLGLCNALRTFHRTMHVI